MSAKDATKVILKKKEDILHKEILFLQKNMSDYKVERKAQWKIFKHKMDDDIGKIKKSIDELCAYHTKLI